MDVLNNTPNIEELSKVITEMASWKEQNKVTAYWRTCFVYVSAVY